MLDMSNSRRAVFPAGIQKAFLDEAGGIIPISEMARLCLCSERTIRDWRREKFHMPLDSVLKIANRTQATIPKHSVRDVYAHTREAGRKGGAAIIAKYGRVPVNEEHRKERWNAWWNTEGKYVTKLSTNPKTILKPEPDARLAEFIGIMMGDGGLSKYQATISLHQSTDAEFSEYVVRQIETLFGVTPSIRDHPHILVRIIVISRIELVRYLHELGLPIGNKIRQHIDIPDWIHKNAEFSVACVRGLVDTDGCIFTHRYRSKGKWYAYKKLSFTSASPHLIQSVFEVLKELGLSPRISKSGRDVFLENVADMQRYFSLIGTSNPKHLKRYKSAVG